MTTRNGGLVGYKISLGLTRPSLQQHVYASCEFGCWFVVCFFDLVCPRGLVVATKTAACINTNVVHKAAKGAPGTGTVSVYYACTTGQVE